VSKYHVPRSPRNKTTFRGHVQTQKAVITNEIWFRDRAPGLGPGFTAADAAKRTTTVTGILLRAARRADKIGNPDLAETYYQLHDKLQACRPRSRCGSLACPLCARAFQKAKIAAQETAITAATETRSCKHLVFVTLIPKTMMYTPGFLHEIDVKRANRWLKDALKPLGRRMMLGSTDLGWETRRGGGYIQLHWHLAMWTNNRKNLKAKLGKIFVRAKRHEKPVHVQTARDLGFLSYMNKVIKLPESLRTNRKSLPELLLVLDKTDPIDLMVYTQHRLTAQKGTLAFRPIGRVEG
jgi:hypothetical protein